MYILIHILSNFLLQPQNCPASLFYLFCKGCLAFFARSLCEHWVGTSANATRDLSNVTT